MGLFDSEKYDLSGCDITDIAAICSALTMAGQSVGDRENKSVISSAHSKLDRGRLKLTEREFRLTTASVLAILAVLQDKKDKGEGDSDLDSVFRMLKSAAEKLTQLI